MTDAESRTMHLNLYIMVYGWKRLFMPKWYWIKLVYFFAGEK